MENISNASSSTDGNTETLYYPCLMSESFRYVQFVSSVIMFVVAIFGNCLILASLIKYSQHFKGSLFIFIGNLAFADLILGVTTSLFILEEIVPDVMNYWQFCYSKTLTFLIPFCASVFFTTCISIDRYMAVLHPFKHHVRSVRKRFFFIWSASIWALVIAIGLCVPLISWSDASNDRNQCRLGLIIPESHSFFASWWLVLMLMLNAVLYGLVVRKIRTNKLPGDRLVTRNAMKTRLMINVFVLYLIFYLPFLVCNILIQFLEPVGQDVICVREYAALVGRMYSCLNWIVFGLDNKKFRTVFKTLLSCKTSNDTNSNVNIRCLSDRSKQPEIVK